MPGPAGKLALTAAVLLAATAGIGVVAADTLSAYGNSTSSAPGTFSAASDFQPPGASASVVQKSSGGDPDYLKPNGTYFVYANVSDGGSPAAGVASVTAGVGNLTTSPTTSAAASGSWTVGGAGYNWRSAQLTAKGTLTNGSAPTYSLTSTDAASPANSQTQSFPVTVDSVAPTATAITTGNVSGGTVGRAEAGDTAAYTSSEPLDPNAILAGWDGSTTNVQATIAKVGSQDVLTVQAVGGAQTNMGALGLSRTDYTTSNATVTFGATGTRSTLTRVGNVITLVLGTPSATTPTAAAAATASWTPVAAATDRAGNAMSTTLVNETGVADKEF